MGHKVPGSQRMGLERFVAFFLEEWQGGLGKALSLRHVRGE